MVMLLSSSLAVVSAAPGDEGLDIVENGTTYLYQTVESYGEEGTQYYGTQTYPFELGAMSTIETNLTITEVNSTEGRIRYRRTTPSSSSTYTVYNDTQLGVIFSYNDVDDDDLIESLTFYPGTFYYVIAGTWENYTGIVDDVVQELDWAKGNVSTFDYTLTINDAAQKITLSLEYQVEELAWSGTEESVIYDATQYFTMDYNNFVIAQFRMRSQYTLNSIVNQSYIEDNDEVVYTLYYEEMSMGPISSEDSGIPGYELFALLGVSIASVFGIAFVIKRKNKIM